MYRFICLMFAIVISATTAFAQEFSDEAKMQMEAAGARLTEASTTANRVAALREIEAIASANPDAPDARLLATMLGQQAMIESGPADLVDALGVLASAGEITDVNTYATIIGPLISTVAEMQENHKLLGATAIALDDAINNLNAVADKIGLPSIADTILEARGIKGLGSTVTDTLGNLAKFAELARSNPDVAAMDEATAKEFVDTFTSLMTLGGRVTISAPLTIAVRDSLVWNQQMFGESAKALNLVADAMATGHLDQEAYGEISDRLNVLSRGPWGSDTAKDVLKSICDSIPLFGKWCGDAFKLAEQLIGGECGAISCDCENVGGGIMRGHLLVSCRLQEQTVIAQCRATPPVVGNCDPGAMGPGATN